MVKCGANLVSDRKVDFSPKTFLRLSSIFKAAQPHVGSGSAMAQLYSIAQCLLEPMSYTLLLPG